MTIKRIRLTNEDEHTNIYVGEPRIKLITLRPKESCVIEYDDEQSTKPFNVVE